MKTAVIEEEEIKPSLTDLKKAEARRVAAEESELYHEANRMMMRGEAESISDATRLLKLRKKGERGETAGLVEPILDVVQKRDALEKEQQVLAASEQEAFRLQDRLDTLVRRKKDLAETLERARTRHQMLRDEWPGRIEASKGFFTDPYNSNQYFESWKALSAIRLIMEHFPSTEKQLLEDIAKNESELKEFVKRHKVKGIQ